MKKYIYAFFIFVSFNLWACGSNDSTPGDDDNKNEEVDKTTDCKSANEKGAYSTWYKPASGWVGDPIPFYDNGTFYVFYLQDWRSGFPFLHPWHMVYSTDLSSFTFGGEVIPCGKENEQDVALGTGGVIKDRETGEYCAFYTGHQWNWQAMGVPTQAVLLTTSKDMKTWTKKGEKNFYLSLRGQSGYVENDFRDPHVFYDEEDGLYKMVVTTHTNAGATLALLTTKTLQDASSWKLQEPLFTDPSIWVMECADVFKEGEYWYLTYSNVADRKVHYRYAKSLKGPWIKPGNDIFDGIGFYAGKTMSNGTERYLAGWCPTRIGDGDPDQWGGSLVCHRMLFNSDGTISLKLPDGIDGKFTNLKKTVLIDKSGKAVRKDDTYLLTDAASVSFPRLTKTCKIEATITATGEDDVFGFAFGACDDKTEVYSIRFDMKTKKIIMSKDDLTRGTNPTQTDVALPIPANKQFNVKIVVEKSVCVMYVNEQVAFSNRIDKMPENPWAIFTDKGTEVSFSNIKVYE
ncbi:MULTISPECIES: glycoside hydrolase family 32 protein [unclassified Bacteroides]|jgi:beta-fructofuranosidase|uniref:glycoside hydrolase family 32 protein n=1 Tax=unclassified Bacteroides TaxID=2646097 RepID=UPI000E88F06A|nr:MULTISPECIES: glycoside hydrolase family 32 protein [unclassified Bacteroides]RGN49922.1 DUF4975 domain-containing protein [Bacteroides sp. OM05-12]RHR81516.1 DUF4975 domain-containing protein [Bacteroides sp. AF16-49]